MSDTDSTSSTPENTPEETPESSPATQPPVQDTAAQESVRILEQRARELQTHIQSFGEEIRAVSKTLDARKRETTVLKIMLYTGVVVLMVAFFYSSNALYRAQLESFQGNLHHLQNITQANMNAMEKEFYRDIEQLKQQLEDLKQDQSAFYLKEQKISEVLRTLNEAVEPLVEKNPELLDQIQVLNENADELNHAYRNHGKGESLFEMNNGSFDELVRP